MSFLTRELGIDLGTANLVIVEGNQVLLNEPTVVAIVVYEQKMVEWGRAARDMFGRVSDTLGGRLAAAARGDRRVRNHRKFAAPYHSQ